MWFYTILFIKGSGVEHSSQAKDELKIVDSTYLIGESPNRNSTNVQLYSYKYSLYNAGDEQIYIDLVEPLFKKDFSVRLLAKERKTFVNKIIEPGTSILIQGQVEFDASNLTKEQIVNSGPYIYGINITSTKTVYYPDQIS